MHVVEAHFDLMIPGQIRPEITEASRGVIIPMGDVLGIVSGIARPTCTGSLASSLSS